MSAPKTRIAGVTFNWRQPGDLPVAIETLAAIGFQGFELAYGFPTWQPYRGSTERHDEVRQLAADNDITCTAMYYGADFYIADTHRAQVDEAIRIAGEVAGLEIPNLIVGFGPRKPDAFGITDDEYRRLAAGLDEIGRACADNGMRLCAHPHINQTIERRHEIRKLFELVDSQRVWMCVDTGHLYAGGADVEEVIGAYADRIGYAHLKDFRDGYYCDLGTGEMPCEAILRALQDAGYNGWLAPEVPARGGSPVANARANFEYLAARAW